MRIRNLVDEAYAYYVSSRSKYTARTYKTGMEKFVEFLSTQGINEDDDTSLLKPVHFKKVGLWMTKGYEDSTLGAYMAGVISLLIYSQMFDETKFSAEDVAQIYRIRKDILRKRQSPLPRTPGDGDVDAMISAARSMDTKSPGKERDIAIVEFLASSGCRVGEVVKISVGDVNMKERTVMVNGKGNKSRWVYFSTKARDAMIDYWEKRGDCSPTSPAFARHDKRASTHMLFMTTMSVQNIVRLVAARAGIENFTPHVFRHGFAVEMLDHTQNLALVQDLMGHADPSATRVYAKVKPERFKEAHQSVFG